MFESEGWHGYGWYTISRGSGQEDWTDAGAVWYEDAVTMIDDFAAAKRSTDRQEDVCVEYHGCDSLPDECLEEDPNSWCDVDPNYLEDPLYYLMCDLADAKTQGTREDIRKALDAIEAYACEF